MITGKLRDTETVMRSLEGGGWKSASNGNSLATHPTSCPVLKPSMGATCMLRLTACIPLFAVNILLVIPNWLTFPANRQGQ